MERSPELPTSGTYAQWYVVPWGGQPRKLRFSVRAMPDNTVRDWPTTLAAIENVVVELGSSGQRLPIPLGDLYKRHLAAVGVTLQQASEIWREAFNLQSETPKARGATPTYSLHKTDQLVSELDLRLGAVYSEALGSARARLNSFQGRVDAGPVATTVTDDWLKSMARVYAPVTERRHPEQLASEMAAPHPVIDPPPTVTHVAGWIVGTVSGIKQTKSATLQVSRTAPGLAFSQQALNYLVNLVWGGRTVPTSYGGDRDGQFLDAFALRYLERRVAYLPDSETKFSPEHSNKGLQVGTGANDRRYLSREEALAGVVTHPWLAKILGLTVDVSCDYSDLDAPSYSEIAVVGVKPKNGASVSVSSPLWTQTVEGLPALKNPRNPYRQGMLDISERTGGFQLVQVDADRTPEKLLQTSLSYVTEVSAGRRASEITVAMQSQESVGLSLVERLGPGLNDRRGSTINASGPSTVDPKQEVYLEHLLLGYRADVQQFVPDSSGTSLVPNPWKSLCRRRIRRVTLAGRDITHWFRRVGEDESVILEKGRVAKDADEATLLLEGELFRWGTWGLGAPRPEATSGPSPRATGTVGKLAVEYDPAGNEAEQRFGHGYRVGMRLAMIDGNSIDLSDAISTGYRETTATTALGDDTVVPFDLRAAPFLRFEYIPPPTILLTNHPDKVNFPNEGARRAIVATSFKSGLARERTRRVLVPPRCPSLDLAIRDGAFDPYRGDVSAPRSAFSDVVLTELGDFPSWTHAYLGVPTAQTRTSERYFNRIGASAPAPRVKYYPDPWATRLILGFYRAGDDRLMYVDFFEYYDSQHQWPLCKELELEVRATLDVHDPVLGFDVDWNGNRLTISLARGVHVILRAWHEIGVAKLNQLAVVEQIVSLAMDTKYGPDIRQRLGLPASRDLEKTRAALVALLSQWETLRDWQGQTPRPYNRKSELVNLTSFWMINPYEEIDLLHATDAPLRGAELAEASKNTPVAPRAIQAPSRTSAIEVPFSVTRNRGETAAMFNGHIRVDRYSTKRVDAVAAFHDNATKAIRRSGSSDPIYTVPSTARSVHLFTVKDLVRVAVDDCGALPPSPLNPELDANQGLQQLNAQIIVARDGKGPPINVTDAFDFGDTRARVIDVELTSVSRFSDDYLPTADHSVKSAPKRVIVPGTERPSPPRIQYVIPLYAWAGPADVHGSLRRTREGGWFRIWLGTEWYSSGNGELLALVCWPKELLGPRARTVQFSRTWDVPWAVQSPSAEIEPYVTRWGLDPLLLEKVEFHNLPAAALQNRLRSFDDLGQGQPADVALKTDLHHLQDIPSYDPTFDLSQLPEIAKPAAPNAASVVLALFRPQCDSFSGRWFADTRIDPGIAFQPFLRLALARYQPHNRPELRLSPIVATEFVQLLPGRDVSISMRDGRSRQETQFGVTFSGVTLAPNSTAGYAKTEITVGIDEQMFGIVPEADVSVINGAWIPVQNPSAHAQMTYDPRDRVWNADLYLERKMSRRYSLSVMEYAQLDDGVHARSRKLVYFDRVMLFS